ncbi:hypothetical protein D3C80_1591680 [compost metagenome]
MLIGVAFFEHALFAESVEIRQLRQRFAGLLVQMAQPFFLRTSFGELLLNAQTAGQFAGHFINIFALESWRDRLIGKNDVIHIAARGIKAEVHLLRGRAVGQDNICVFR